MNKAHRYRYLHIHTAHITTGTELLNSPDIKINSNSITSVSQPKRLLATPITVCLDKKLAVCKQQKVLQGTWQHMNVCGDHKCISILIILNCRFPPECTLRSHIIFGYANWACSGFSGVSLISRLATKSLDWTRILCNCTKSHFRD